MVRVLAVGDPHADGLPSVLTEKQSRAAIQSIFTQAVDAAYTRNIANIVVLGDVFDGYPGSMESHMDVLSFVKQCTSKQIKLFILDGNHGFIKRGKTSLSLLQHIATTFLDDVHVFTGEPTVTSIDKTRCAFLPWPHNKVPTKEPSLVFAHCQRQGVITESGFVMADADKFPLGKHFWIIGDNHHPQRKKGFIYPGAPLPLKFGDINERFFLDLEYKNGAVKSTSDIPIMLPYRLGVLHANSFDDLEPLNDRPDNEYTKVVVGPQLISSMSKINKKWDRLKLQPQIVPKKHVATTDDTPVKELVSRDKILQRRLKADGLTPTQVKRALKMADALEKKFGKKD